MSNMSMIYVYGYTDRDGGSIRIDMRSREESGIKKKRKKSDTIFNLTLLNRVLHTNEVSTRTVGYSVERTRWFLY